MAAVRAAPLLVAIVVAPLLLMPQPSAAADAATCADVHLIGARGSAQNATDFDGYGVQVDALRS